jgi:hypothetical protein
LQRKGPAAELCLAYSKTPTSVSFRKEKQFKTSFKIFQKNMEAKSTKATDEEGYKLSKCKVAG